MLTESLYANYITDVVTVPDFSNPKRYADFTARTLFFLSSWELRVGSAREKLRLHLACIGEPPEAVRVLAEEVGAFVHVFPPFSIGPCKFANKMRGLEIPENQKAGERVLMLDTDVFFVNDPLPLLQTIPVNALSAGEAGTRRVPEDHWVRIYKALNLPEPKERLPMLNVALDIWDGPVIEGKGKIKTDLRSVRPYFNSGVLVFPWKAPLRVLWPQHLEIIYDLFAPPKNLWEKATLWLLDPQRAKPLVVVSESDQAGLATSFQELINQGYPFQALPYALHARQPHFESGVLRFEDTAIWHGVTFGRKVYKWDDVRPHLTHFCAKFDSALDEGAKRRGENVPPSTAAFDFVNELWENRIVPLVAKYPVE